MRWTRRLVRRLILASGRRMSPESMLERSRRGALAAVRAAARQSPAYRELLREHGVSWPDWERRPDLAALPVLTKDDTFGRFALPDLAGPGLAPQDLGDVLTSSGRGGQVFGFRVSRRREHERAWFDIDLGLQDAFGVDEVPTLIVNCLPMGVIFSSRAATVANVSVREDMACAILRELGPRYGQVIVCTDPLFVLRLLARGQADGVDWARLNTSFILGEEMLVEAQRDYIAARVGLDLEQPSPRLVASSFGAAELGLNLLFETRETIRMRRALRRDSGWRSRLGLAAGADDDLPSVFCYNPLRSLLEIVQPDAAGGGELCFTMLSTTAVIALPRYTTGDRGRLLGRTETIALAAAAGVAAPWLPVVLVSGRLSDRSRGGAPSVEAVKEWLYGEPALADLSSGAFRVGLAADGAVLLKLQARDPAADAARREELAAAAAADLALRWRRPVRLAWAAPGEPGWGPALDYERKFNYHLPGG